jgi:hypothetical protein
VNESELRAAYRDWCWVFEEPERKAKSAAEYERNLGWLCTAMRQASERQMRAMYAGMRALTPEEARKYNELMAHSGGLGSFSWVAGLLGVGGGTGR